MVREAVRDGVTSARIADALRASILRGEHSPGTRIVQEELATDYGASRVPVREALRILESEGLVTLIANTGAWISRLSFDECDEIYQIRERIEPLLLRYSLPGLDAADVAALRLLAEQMELATDVEEFLKLDREFHLASYARATTTLLGETVHRLWNTTQHYRRAYAELLDDDSSRILHDEHHMLLAAIDAHDADEAERVLFGHIRRTRLQLGRHPEVFAN